MTIFSESFDSYNGTGGTEGYQSRWTMIVAGSNTPPMVAGRFGGQAWGITASFNDFLFGAPLGFSTSSFSFSVAYRRDNTTGISAGGHFMLGSGSAPDIGFRVSNEGILTVARDMTQNSSGTALYTGNLNDIPVGAWDTIRVAGTIHATTGTLEVWLGATQLYSGTGLNTQGSGAAAVDSAFIAFNGTGNGIAKFTMDDIVVRNDATLLPECRCQPLAPTSDGGTLNLTPSTGTSHYAVVDEATVSTTDYLSGSADGEYDLLGCADLSVVPASILALKALGFAAKTDAGSRAWNLGIESSGTTVDGADLSLSTSVGYAEHIYDTDPDTSAAWTQTGVNAVQLKPTVVVP